MSSVALSCRCYHQVNMIPLSNSSSLTMHLILFTSPKFFRKIIHTSTLSELARHVPLTQIDIPPAVYRCVFPALQNSCQLLPVSPQLNRENLKFEGEITLPVPTRSSIFGVPLEELMGYNAEKGGIPRVVKDSIQFLRDSGLPHVIRTEFILKIMF